MREPLVVKVFKQPPWGNYLNRPDRIHHVG